MAEETGVDFIQLSGNKLLSIKNKGIIYKDIGVKLAEKVKIPIIVTGGVRSVDEMNEVLNNSKIQYFGLARPLMCENDLIKKWKEGKTKKQNVFHAIHALYQIKIMPHVYLIGKRQI